MTAYNGSNNSISLGNRFIININYFLALHIQINQSKSSRLELLVAQISSNHS